MLGLFSIYIFTTVWFIFQIFYPETTDIYDKKNMPRTIYCLHALRFVWYYVNAVNKSDIQKGKL